MRETNFKQTEVGLIPKDWDVKTLGELGSFVSGSGFPMKFQGHKQGTIPFYKVSDMNIEGNDLIMSTSNNYISENIWESFRPTKIPPHAIVYAKIGAAIYLERKRLTSSECCIDNNMQAFICNENIDFKFTLYSLLCTPFAEKVSSTALPAISTNDLRTILLGVPSKREQEKIAQTLSNIDDLIYGLKKLIEKKRAIKSAAMSQLLSGKLRLPGFTEPWVSSTLDETGILLSNNTLSRDNLTESGTIGNIHYGDVLIKFGAILDLDNTSIPFISPDLTDKFVKSHKAEEGDIIFADTAEDETVGKATELVNVKDRAIVSGLHTFWFRPLKKFASKFLGYTINSKNFHQQVIPVISGTKVCSISKPNLLNFTLSYPCNLEEQKAIAKVLTDMDDEISALEAKLKKYEQLKKGMMQQLLTGKIRLVSPNEFLS